MMKDIKNIIMIVMIVIICALAYFCMQRSQNDLVNNNDDVKIQTLPACPSYLDGQCPNGSACCSGQCTSTMGCTHTN